MAKKKAITSHSEEALLKWVKEADEMAQTAEEQIAALTLAIKALVSKQMNVATVSAIRTLSDQISDVSFTLMNNINSDAEGFGANYSSHAEASHG